MIENKELIDKIITNLISTASRVNAEASRKDINRNHVNYGAATTNASILNLLGVNTDIPCWEDDNGCLRIPYIIYGDKKLEFHDGK